MKQDKALEILQSNNVTLAESLASVCVNVMEKMVEFSSDIQNEKQALNIMQVSKSVQEISGLTIPEKIDVNITNKIVGGFEFIEISDDDIIEIEPIATHEHEFRRKTEEEES